MSVVHPTSVPITAALRAYVEATRAMPRDVSDRLLGADLDPRTTAQVLGTTVSDESAAELGYGRWVPFEVVPFAWQGGDALQYAHLVMAEELGTDDWLAVSFAPEEMTVSWLGDDTAHALANLLATEREHGVLEDDPDEPSRTAARESITRSLALPPGVVLRPGARSGRRAVPTVPPGYRHVVGATGVGVLAPLDAFAPIDPSSVPFEELEERADALLAQGAPASALQLLALQRAEADDAGERAACERMVKVYQALGRPTLARRVEHYLRGV